MSDLSIPLDGLRRAESQINTSASRIARAFTAPSSGEDTVDLSTEIVNLLQNRRVAEANISAFHTMDDVQKRLIDIMG